VLHIPPPVLRECTADEVLAACERVDAYNREIAEAKAGR
jgi:hypothetical protein